MYQIESVEQLLREISEPGSKRNFNIVLVGEDGVGKEYYARAIHKFRKGKDKFLLFDFEVEHSAQKEQIEFLVTGGPECFLKKAKTNTFFLRRVDFLEQRLMLQLQNLFREVRSFLVNKTFRFMELGIICSVNDRVSGQGIKNSKNLLGEFFVLEVHIPPLRERKAELYNLIRRMFSEHNPNSEEKTLQAFIDYENLLISYSWPGNLNELQSVIERAGSLAEIDEMCLKSLFQQKPKERVTLITSNSSDELEQNRRGLKECQNLIACCSFFS